MNRPVWLIMLKDGSYEGLLGNVTRPEDAIQYSDKDSASSIAESIGGTAVPFAYQTFKLGVDGETITRI